MGDRGTASPGDGRPSYVPPFSPGATLNTWHNQFLNGVSWDYRESAIMPHLLSAWSNEMRTWTDRGGVASWSGSSRIAFPTNGRSNAGRESGDGRDPVRSW